MRLLGAQVIPRIEVEACLDEKTEDKKKLKNLKRLICIAALKAKIPEACLFCSSCAQSAASPLVRCYSFAFPVRYIYIYS